MKRLKVTSFQKIFSTNSFSIAYFEVIIAQLRSSNIVCEDILAGYLLLAKQVYLL